MNHDEEFHGAQPESLEAGYEVKDINVLIIAILALACIALVAGFAIGLNEYFVMTREQLYETQVMGAPSEQLVKLRDHAADLLGSYGVVDKEKGIYRIPIDRAMELMLQKNGAVTN